MNDIVKNMQFMIHNKLMQETAKVGSSKGIKNNADLYSQNHTIEHKGPFQQSGSMKELSYLINVSMGNLRTRGLP